MTISNSDANTIPCRKVFNSRTKALSAWNRIQYIPLTYTLVIDIQPFLHGIVDLSSILKNMYTTQFGKKWTEALSAWSDPFKEPINSIIIIGSKSYNAVFLNT